MREAALSELGSAPRLGVDSCVGGSETRSTADTIDDWRTDRDTDQRILLLGKTGQLENYYRPVTAPHAHLVSVE